MKFVSYANSTYYILISNHQIRSKRIDKLAFGVVRIQDVTVAAVAVIAAVVTLFLVIMSVIVDNDVYYKCCDIFIVFNNRVCVSR